MFFVYQVDLSSISMHAIDTRCPEDEAGFSLIELLTSVAIVGILTTVAVPVYSGYMENTRTGVVKDQLRAVHLQQQEYYAMYNSYYSSGEDCEEDAKSAINAALFAGENILQEPSASFCITQVSTSVFLAQASYAGGDGSSVFTIDHQGNSNF